LRLARQQQPGHVHGDVEIGSHAHHHQDQHAEQDGETPALARGFARADEVGRGLGGARRGACARALLARALHRLERPAGAALAAGAALDLLERLHQ
jgi:hypothetical protein